MPYDNLFKAIENISFLKITIPTKVHNICSIIKRYSQTKTSNRINKIYSGKLPLS